MLRTWIIHNHINYENCFYFSGLLRRWLGRAAFLRLWRGKIFLHLEKVKNFKILKVQKLFWNYFWFLKYSKKYLVGIFPIQQSRNIESSDRCFTSRNADAWKSNLRKTSHIFIRTVFHIAKPEWHHFSLHFSRRYVFRKKN